MEGMTIITRGATPETTTMTIKVSDRMRRLAVNTSYSAYLKIAEVCGLEIPKVSKRFLSSLEGKRVVTDALAHRITDHFDKVGLWHKSKGWLNALLGGHAMGKPITRERIRYVIDMDVSHLDQPPPDKWRTELFPAGDKGE